MTGSPDLVAASLDEARTSALRYATRLHNGDRRAAEDLVQDVLTDLWVRARTTGAPYTAGYVTRSVRNAWINRWRHRELETRKLPLLHAPPTDDAGATVAEMRIELERLLARLPAPQRQLLTLRYLDGLSQDEVATLLDLPKGTVASRSARALGHLRALAAA